MKGIIALIITLFSVITGLMFFFSLLSGMIRIYQGDIANGTEAIVNATADEIINSVKQSVVISIAIAFASFLGLTGLVAFLRKL